MPLTATQRRTLAASAHALSPAVTLAESEISDSVAAHVRRQFLTSELIKVRVNTRDRQIFTALVEQLAAKVPCEIVRRIGRVAILYCPGATADENG
jgi:putative YhbY family RNA-binding protein